MWYISDFSFRYQGPIIANIKEKTYTESETGIGINEVHLKWSKSFQKNKK